MKRKRILTNKEKGFVLLAGSLMLLFTIPMVGLAIDAGFMYVVKARLSSSADAAALAAARQLSVGQTMSAQEASAISRAQAFFAANYPAAMWNTTNRSLTVSVAETGFRTRTVTVNATVDAPLFFTRILTTSPTTVVGTVGRASRRDVNVMMVVDRSGSMNTNGGCAAMRTAANSFVNLFAHERDVLGMVTYGISYSLTYTPTKYFKNGSPTLPQRIDSITCAGGTGISQALYRGYEQIVGLNEPGALNVILLFTDGIPNTVSANFPVNALDATRVADYSLSASSNKRSRCYDYEHGRRYNYSGTGTPWSPSTNMVYRGAVYAQEGLGSGDTISGILGASTTTFSDASSVSRPHQSPTSNTQYTASGNENDCWFRGGNGAGTGSTALQYDLAYYPDNDMYGTSMISSDNFRTLSFYPTSHVYANRISVNDTTNMMNAAINTVDNMGKRIRANDLNANINTVVYAIGLGEASTDQHTLLRRVANDPLSPIFDATKLEGMYVFAPTAADLNSAFVKIAAEILRYAQ